MYDELLNSPRSARSVNNPLFISSSPLQQSPTTFSYRSQPRVLFYCDAFRTTDRSILFLTHILRLSTPPRSQPRISSPIHRKWQKVLINDVRDLIPLSSSISVLLKYKIVSSYFLLSVKIQIGRGLTGAALVLYHAATEAPGLIRQREAAAEACATATKRERKGAHGEFVRMALIGIYVFVVHFCVCLHLKRHVRIILRPTHPFASAAGPMESRPCCLHDRRAAPASTWVCAPPGEHCGNALLPWEQLHSCMSEGF